jgi:hypothetical protein
MAWEKIPESTVPTKGATYRIGLQIKAPYSKFLADTIKNAIKAGNALRNLNPFEELHNKVEIRSVYHSLPPVSSRTGRSEPWWIYVEFMKRSENPAIVIIYGLIALIVVAASAVLISGKSFERLIVTGAEAIDKTITGSTGALTQVLNPGLILGAFVLGFLYLSKRTA